MGGMGLAAIVGGLIAVLANAIYRGGADAGDWLQFFGGMLGAALAVGGALWLEERSRRRNRLESIAVIEKILRDWLDDIEMLAGHRPPKGAELKDLMAHMGLVIDRADAVITALKWMPRDAVVDLSTLRRITWLRGNFARWLPSMKAFCEVNVERMNSGVDEFPYFTSLMAHLEPHKTIVRNAANRLGEILGKAESNAA